MKCINLYNETKRGNQSNSRNEKNPNGFSKTIVDQGKLRKYETGLNYRMRDKYKNTILKLCLYNSCDVLNCNKFRITKIKKEHPKDNGYFKEVYVLTPKARNLFRLKKQQINGGG